MIDNAGVDTLGIEYKELVDIETLLGDEAVLGKYVSSTKTGAVRVAIKPSKTLNGGIVTTRIEECLKVFRAIEHDNDLKNGLVYRVDIACDSKILLTDNRNLFRMFLECLNIKRTGIDVFVTKRGLNNLANLKIKNRYVETTVYNCVDKVRIGNTRIENRVLEIRSNGDDLKKLRYEFNKYIAEISCLDKNIEIVENRYIDNLIKLYNNENGNSFRSFSEFVVWADKEGYILTSRILKELFIFIKPAEDYTHFVREFRRTRKTSLNFTSKAQLKNLISSMKKELKKAM